MTAFDPVARPIDVKLPQGQTEETAEKQKEREEQQQYANRRLKELVPNDEMYNAIEYYLLGDPERQIEQLGDVSNLIQEGDGAKREADYMKARYSYETAAKMELYRGKKESLRKLLTLAHEVTSEDLRFFRFQQTILDDIDTALRIAKEYYKSVPQSQES